MGRPLEASGTSPREAWPGSAAGQPRGLLIVVMQGWVLGHDRDGWLIWQRMAAGSDHGCWCSEGRRLGVSTPVGRCLVPAARSWQRCGCGLCFFEGCLEAQCCVGPVAGRGRDRDRVALVVLCAVQSWVRGCPGSSSSQRPTWGLLGRCFPGFGIRDCWLFSLTLRNDSTVFRPLCFLCEVSRHCFEGTCLLWRPPPPFLPLKRVCVCT